MDQYVYEDIFRFINFMKHEAKKAVENCVSGFQRATTMVFEFREEAAVQDFGSLVKTEMPPSQP